MRTLRIGFASIASLVLVAGVSLATPAPTLGSNGFIEKATTTYVVNADQQRLDVTIDLTFKNTKRSTATAIYYFNGDYVWLEKEAKNVRASSPGASIRISKGKTSGEYTEYRFRWSPVLFYGKTRSVRITYQIPSGAPRSTSWFRISPAYLDFCVIGTGLDGGETRVKVPVDYTMSVDSQENGRLSYTINGDIRTYSTGTNDDAFKFWACLTGEQPGEFASTSVTAPSGREIDIQSWPDDPSWASDISVQIDEVLARLEELIGLGLPGDGPIAVREVGAGTLGQYAGFFDPETGVARIGEDLEAKGLIVHELSHAWFNGDLFQSRWLSEGYAEWARISVDTDLCPTPAFPGKGSPDLEDWQFAGPRATDEELAIVDYQYAAACALVRQVAGRIGEDGMRKVLDALINHGIAYRDGGSVLSGPYIAASWQTWLDAVDELGLANENKPGDAATVADLLVPYGITRSSSAALEQRARARDAYHTLQAKFGDWLVPPVILQSMAGWHYDVATEAMTTATKVFETVSAVSDVLPGAGDGANVRSMLQGATSQTALDAALAAADDRLAAAREVASARDALGAPRDLVMEAGLLGTDLQPALDAAVAAIGADDLPAARSGAQAIQAALVDAPKQGQLRLAVGIGLPLLLLLLFAASLVVRRRRRRRAAAAAVTIVAEVAALEAPPALEPPIEVPAPATPVDAPQPAPSDPPPAP